MTYYQTVKETAKDLKKDFKDLSIADALLIAAKIEQAELIAGAIKDGLLVNTSNKPVALEAIAMQLGFKGNMSGTDLTEAVMSIQDAISNKD